MKKVIAIGEALIDMIPQGFGKIEDIVAFTPKIGGAPANVLGAIVKLGGQGQLLSQLGQDPFGDKIVHALEGYCIDTSAIKRSDTANTALAFVSLLPDGQRDFSFYRSPSADMLYEASDVQEDIFNDAYALHFCSVDLVDCPMKKAHDQAIAYAKKHGVLVSFDPNLRLPLWKDHKALKDTVHAYFDVADIVKLSDEEIPFLFGESTIEEVAQLLFAKGVQLLVYTCGKDGAMAFTPSKQAKVDQMVVKAVDTTGAGDGFIGSMLFQLGRDEIIDVGSLTQDQLQKYLSFSNRFCAYSVQRHGAIDSYPTYEDLEN